MATFKDMAGQERAVRITVRHLAPLRERNGIALGDLIKDETKLRDLLSDPEKFGTVLHTLCGRPDETADEFLDALDGPALERAAAPFLEAVTSFFRGPKAGAAVAKQVGPRIAEAVGRAEAAIDRLTESPPTSSESPGNSPASSASIPAT